MQWVYTNGVEASQIDRGFSHLHYIGLGDIAGEIGTRLQKSGGVSHERKHLLRRLEQNFHGWMERAAQNVMGAWISLSAYKSELAIKLARMANPMDWKKVRQDVEQEVLEQQQSLSQMTRRLSDTLQESDYRRYSEEAKAIEKILEDRRSRLEPVIWNMDPLPPNLHDPIEHPMVNSPRIGAF